jgi:predicted PurR-regulated permease PerM
VERPADSRRSLADAAAVAAVAGVVATCLVALCVVLVKAQAVVLALFGAIVIAEAARPIVDRLSIWIPRPVALATTFAAVSGAIALVWAIPIRALEPQIAGFWRVLPAYQSAFLTWLAPYAGAVRPPAGGLASALRSMGGELVPLARGVAGVETGIAACISTLVLVLLMAMFWLTSSNSLQTFVLSLLQPVDRDAANGLFGELSEKLGRYVSGTLINGTIVALGSMVLLSLIGAPYAIVLGLLQGLLVAIPYLGTLVAVLTVGGVVLAAQGWARAAEAVALISVMEGLEGTFISPLIFKQSVDVAPLSTVLATAIGGSLFGISGVVLAVPAAAVLQTLTVRLLAPAIRRFSEQ